MEKFLWSLWRSSSPLSFVVRGILRPLSWPFAFGNILFNFLYDHNFLKVSRFPLKVISIGNITVGGTGKTPFLLWLSQALEERGKEFAVISRGYRSAVEKEGMVVQKETEELHKAGDEAQLLYRHLKKPLIFLGRDRLSSLRKAKEMNVPMALLDDGFQKRSIHRDIDFVLLDRRDPFGKEAFLPSGFLRDRKASLKRADFLVADESFDSSWIKILRNFTEAPIIYTKTTYEVELRARKEINSHAIPLRALSREEPVALFAGIAAPERFAEAMRSLGFSVVYKKWLKDHAPITAFSLEKIWREAQQLGAKALVCTEKDAVKIPENVTLPIAVLQMKVNIDPLEGQKILDTILT